MTLQMLYIYISLYMHLPLSLCIYVCVYVSVRAWLSELERGICHIKGVNLVGPSRFFLRTHNRETMSL